MIAAAVEKEEHLNLDGDAPISRERPKAIEPHPVTKTLADGETTTVIPDPKTGTPAKLTKHFLLGGHAIFTVANPAGTRYTFRVTKKELIQDGTNTRVGVVYFVGFLSGPDNVASYSYLGIVNPDSGEVRLTKKSKAGENAQVTKVARWIIRVILTGGLIPDGYYLNHAGRCGRCGRTLTTPESIERGIGPDCWAQLS